MPHSLGRFVSEARARITVSAAPPDAVRLGHRMKLSVGADPNTLAWYVAGQIPYFYRAPASIADDFASRHHALEMVRDIATKAPTKIKFQRSHCGEILAALFVEEVLGFRRLYSKLTMTTAENTNVHKMDGFFVDTSSDDYVYYWVEAKCSILPTAKTKFSGHRHGILKQLVESLSTYSGGDLRFDLTTIRDRLDSGAFDAGQAARIKSDLIPPGPLSLRYLGIATVNESTLCSEDDDFILATPCSTAFDFEGLAVGDLDGLAATAFGHVNKLRNSVP